MRKKLLATLRGFSAVVLMLFATNFLPVAASFAAADSIPGSGDITWGQQGRSLATAKCSTDESAVYHFVLSPSGTTLLTAGSISVTYDDESGTATGSLRGSDGSSGSGYYDVTAPSSTSTASNAVVSGATWTYETHGNSENIPAPQLELSHVDCVDTTPAANTATAGTVTYVDLCGTDSDTYTVPSTEHVTYMMGDQTVAADTYDGSGTVTITAVADQGYTLTAPYKFKHTFKTKACPETKEKVKLCHATAAIKNPYRTITVNKNAADGIAGNSGQRADHFDHVGLIFDPTTNHNGDNWGDIIPPVDGNGGLNWDAFGQAVYNNDCNLPTKVTPATVTFTQPTCDIKAGSYTVPTTTGVQYQVSLNGGSFQNVSAGTNNVAAGTSVAVRAVAMNKTLFLTGTTSWSSTFTAKTDCGSVLDAFTGGQGGDVLGASTLANTGESPWAAIIVGVTVISLTLTSAFASRRIRLDA